MSTKELLRAMIAHEVGSPAVAARIMDILKRAGWQYVPEPNELVMFTPNEEDFVVCNMCGQKQFDPGFQCYNCGLLPLGQNRLAVERSQMA